MSFSKKIYCAIAGMSLLIGLVISVFLYHSTKALREEEYRAQYEEKVALLGESFKILEKASDSIAYNAAQVVSEKYRASHKILSNAQLLALAPQLGVANMEIINRKGDFVRSSGNTAQKNLFAFCSDYKKVFSEGITEQTPVIPSESGTDIYKYTVVPSFDRKIAIDVSVHFDFVTRLVREMIQSDPDLESVELLAPSGTPLGSITKAGVRPEMTAPMKIERSVPANISNCCECRTKQLVADGENYSYHFVALVSLQSFNRALAAQKWKFAFVFLVSAALSFLVASLLTQLLLMKIRKIRAVVDDITESQDFSKKIPLDNPSTRDELDSLAVQFNQMTDSLQKSQERLITAKSIEAQALIAEQVAHDIRSPLTSIGIALHQMAQQGQDRKTQDFLSTVGAGVDRVTGIIGKLSAQYSKKKELSHQQTVEIPKLTLVDQILREIIKEQELKLSPVQHLLIEGFPKKPSLWAVVQVVEIQSAISNLLNNAAEALPAHGGEITLSLSVQNSVLTLKISDNGKGIPPENLNRIFERNFTSGKSGGTGLGLFQAQSAIQWGGGKLEVSSQVGTGTTFTITLPLEEKPSWFAEGIELKSGRKIAFVDDDPTILQAWKNKLAGSPRIQSFYFESVLAFQREIGKLGPDFVLIIDQNLGPESQTGLETLSELGLNDRGYLCTTRYDDAKVQEKVRSLKAFLIPKPCIESFKIGEMP